VDRLGGAHSRFTLRAHPFHRFSREVLAAQTHDDRLRMGVPAGAIWAPERVMAALQAACLESSWMKSGKRSSLAEPKRITK